MHEDGLHGSARQDRVIRRKSLQAQRRRVHAGTSVRTGSLRRTRPASVRVNATDNSVNVVQAMLTDKEIRQYFDEAVTQTVAGSIAEAFNHLATDRGLCVAVKMLPVSVVSLPQLVAHLKSYARKHARASARAHTHTHRQTDGQTDGHTPTDTRMHARTHALLTCN